LTRLGRALTRLSLPLSRLCRPLSWRGGLLLGRRSLLLPGLGLILTETLLGLGLGLALGLIFETAAVFFLALAGLGSLALGLLCRLPDRQRAGGLFGLPPLFGLVDLGLRERRSARGALFISQLPQHDTA
jgi:hypothetical protein